MLSQLLLPLYGGGFVPAFTQLAVVYYGVGCLFHWVVPAAFPVHNIQKRSRGNHDVLRDSLLSLGPITIKALVWWACEQLHRRGLSQLYSGPVLRSPAHAAYLTLCVLALDVAHDSWFYWTHRLLHKGALYQNVHYMHHQSSVPSAFSGYSFHVLEACLMFANEILICFVLPLHLGLHRVYHLATTSIHQGGHAGYEMAPFMPTVANALVVACKGLRHSCAALNTVQHHDLHHRCPNRHFSLYFTHWDRWCGTIHPQYDAQLFTYFQPAPDEGRDAGCPAKES